MPKYPTTPGANAAKLGGTQLTEKHDGATEANGDEHDKPLAMGTRHGQPKMQALNENHNGATEADGGEHDKLLATGTRRGKPMRMQAQLKAGYHPYTMIPIRNRRKRTVVPLKRKKESREKILLDGVLESIQEYRNSQNEVMEAWRENNKAIGRTFHHIHQVLEALVCPDTTDEDRDGED